MKPSDLAGEVEAEAGAARLRLQAIERFEDVLVLRRWNAGAFIAHLETARCVSGDGDHAGAAAMVDGVAHQIGQRAFDLQRIGLDLHLAGRRLKSKIVAGLTSGAVKG